MVVNNSNPQDDCVIMLRDLHRFVNDNRKPAWKKDVVKGLCANKGCMETSSKECTVCGIRYCCSVCQKEDWRARHKHFCKPKDIRRTEIIFNIFNQRLKDYESGKTSWERYMSIASIEIFKRRNSDELEGINGPFKILNRDEVSGRVVTFLTKKEIYELQSGNVVCRIQNEGMQELFLINHHSLRSLGSEGSSTSGAEQLHAMLTEVVELVPFNRNYQHEYVRTIYGSIIRATRAAWYKELEFFLSMIGVLIHPGIGTLVGNPVFLSLESTLAYEDFIVKNAFGDYFSIDLFCCIMFPSFKPSMLTGNPEHDSRYLSFGDNGEPEYTIEKDSVFEDLDYNLVFDSVLRKEEADEIAAVYRRTEEEEKNDTGYDEGYVRSCNYRAKYEWWFARYFDMSVVCSESLALVPVEESEKQINSWIVWSVLEKIVTDIEAIP